METLKNVATILSCVISDITHSVTVEWWLNATHTVTSGADPGTRDDYGTQTATLTIPAEDVTNDAQYTCSVTSGQFPGSPTSETTVSLTIINS